MFEQRYGKQISNARAELAAAVRPGAEQVAALLRETSVSRTPAPYPLGRVRDEFAGHNAVLMAAVQAYPLALAINTATGNPDRLGDTLATLISGITHTVVLYRGLDTLPDTLFGRVHRELEGLVTTANAVVIHTSPQ